MATKNFIDQMGREIKVEFPPKRIISLVPSQTELLFDLGLDNEVCGITKFCVHPKDKWKSKTKVGGTKQFRFEKIAELQPDLLIGNKEENERLQIETLEKQYPVWMSDIKTLEDALKMIGQVGHLTNKALTANKLADQIQDKFSELKHLTVEKAKPRAAFFIWRNPYMVVGQDTFINTMMEEAGFQNVFFDKTRYPETTLEEVANYKPDVIMLSSEPYPFSAKHFEEFRQQCRDSVVTLVDGEFFSWYGSRMLQAAPYFAKLHQNISQSLKSYKL